MRKMLSRCQDYQNDFPLQCLLYDISLARQISGIVSVAKRQERAPGGLTDHLQNYAPFWRKEQDKLEDVCRQRRCMPNVFMTIAPAEWTFSWHRGLFERYKQDGDLSTYQTLMTLHTYHVLQEMLRKHLLVGPNDATGFQSAHVPL